MNRLVCFVTVLGVVSAQRWGNNDNGDWRGDDSSYHAPRQPVVPAPLAHDGRVIDTPEIQNAKAAHFAAHDRALRANPPKPYNADYRVQEYNRGDDYERKQEYRAPQQYREQPQQDYNRNDDYDNEEKQEPRWRGPLAKIEFTQDGKFIKETPEVAHARAQHLAALSHAKQSSFYQPEEPQQRYQEQPKYQGEQPKYQGEQQNNNYDDGQYREEHSKGGNSWQGNQGNQYNTGRGYDVYDNGNEQSGQYSRNWQGPAQIAKTRNTYY